MGADRAVDVAKRLYLQGRATEAETLYRELLSQEPDAPEALEGLGVMLFQKGRTAEAADLFARGLALDPRSSRFHANLGEALRTSGQHNAALLHLRTAVALDPADIQAWNSLGLAAHDLGRNAAAEFAFREAIRLRPRFVPAYVNLANALLALKRVREAADALRAALRIEPNNALALANLGSILIEMSDPDLWAEAEVVCRRALALAPQYSLALAALGRVLRLRARLDEAHEFEQRALELGSRRQAGTVPDPATGVTPAQPESAPRLGPGHAQHTQGLAHHALGELDQAEACLREALQLDPSMDVSWVKLAEIQAERGEFEQSCQSARSALAVDPLSAEAYWRIATNLQGQLSAVEVQEMERALLDQSLSNDDRALLHFGLAGVMDQRGLYARAAAHYEAANLHQSARKCARGLAYDPDTNTQVVNRIIAAYSPEFLARGRGWGNSDPRPVFIVGFPRSGTTLTEQVLASHPRVHGGGELHDLNQVFRSLPELIGLASGDPFDALKLLGPDSAKAAAQRYLDRLDDLAPPTAARVVDKMPDNIDHLGLIALLFRSAKVIICQRDPGDIALSCWQTGFRLCPWNNDWDHIARRLANYQRVLLHWRQVQPLPCLHIHYEDMVAELDRHARLLTDFVGLEWDPACLEFHSNPRVVRTPSLVQVRQPVHSRSVGRWRHYEASLKPMFQAFERHGVDPGKDHERS